MAKTRGWWTLDATVELEDCDIEHIAEMIKRGFTSGEICATETPEPIWWCPTCGHDWPCIDDETSSVCPECGTAVPVTQD